MPSINTAIIASLVLPDSTAACIACSIPAVGMFMNPPGIPGIPDIPGKLVPDVKVLFNA
jgi:hypothetical protein